MKLTGEMREGKAASRRGVTRVDAVMAAAALGMLFLTAASAIDARKPRIEQAVCLNNLRQLGYGLSVWSADHSDRPPWRVSRSEGGSMGGTSAAFLQWSMLSNVIDSPRILVCPSDTERFPARHWGTSQGGLNSPQYRNNGVSYTVGLDVFADHPGSVLAGDRNMNLWQPWGQPPLFEYCFYSGNMIAIKVVQRWGGIIPYFESSLAWTNAIHGEIGNLLFQDGSARKTTTPELRAAFIRYTDGGAFHVLPSF